MLIIPISVLCRYCLYVRWSFLLKIKHSSLYFFYRGHRCNNLTSWNNKRIKNFWSVIGLSGRERQAVTHWGCWVPVERKTSGPRTLHYKMLKLPGTWSGSQPALADCHCQSHMCNNWENPKMLSNIMNYESVHSAHLLQQIIKVYTQKIISNQSPK